MRLGEGTTTMRFMGSARAARASAIWGRGSKGRVEEGVGEGKVNGR